VVTGFLAEEGSSRIEIDRQLGRIHGEDATCVNSDAGSALSIAVERPLARVAVAVHQPRQRDQRQG
jgi:hypothetical protein